VDDGNVPLARLPKTGERKNNAGKVMVTLSGFMLALYAALTKKNKEKENN
jgi:LPXTG-motif cell wall-anchored protein